MADVNLVIRAHLRGERELNKAERKLLRIAVAAKAADNNMASLGASSKKFARIMNQTTERFERIMTDWDKLVKGFGTLITKTLGMATKFMVVEFAAVAASMIVVHALFKIGRWLMKGYHGAIKMIAGAATSAAAALSVLSAAIREQQAAMFSYKGLERNYKDLKNGISAVRSEMRGLSTDVVMAAMGIENLNTMFAGASQRGTFSKSLSKGLLDIASAGQPLEAAAKWVGEIVGLLTDPDIKPGELRDAFKGLGAIGERTWKMLTKRGITSVQEIQAAIRSGLISEIAGVEGQWDAVSGTLVSRFKAAFTVIRTDFADIGDAFLGDVKGSLDEMTIVFRRLLFRIRGDIIKFGKGGLLGGMVSAMEKIEENMIKLVDKWLPMAEGMFGRIADWWGRFTDGWKKVTSSLAPLLFAAKVLEDMFMNILRPVGDYLSESFNSLRIFLIDSKKDFLAHGDAIGSLLTALLGFKTAWTEMFQDAMPFINKLIDGVTQLVDLFTSVTKGIGGVVKGIGNAANAMGGGAGGAGGSGGFGSAFMMMGMIQGFKSMRGTEGTWREQGLNLQDLNTMTVTAATVNINGAPMGGTVGGSKALADYSYAPSQAVIHGKAPGSIGAGAAAAGLAGAAAGATGLTRGGIVKRRIPARDRQLFGATPYVTASRYPQGVYRPGAGHGAGYTSPNEQLSMDTLLAQQAATPYFNESTLRWHRPDKEFGAGNIVTNKVGMASIGLSPTGGVLEEYMKPQGAAEQGSMFGPGIGAAAAGTVSGSAYYDERAGNEGRLRQGRGFAPRAQSYGALDPASMATMAKRQGTGGLGAFLGGAYGTGTGGEGQMDFSQMTPSQLKMMVSAEEFVPSPSGKINPATGMPFMERNPFYGKGAGETLGAAARGKMKWKGKGGVKANLKAAWQREKMMSTTRMSKGPAGPQTKYQKGRTRLMKRLGAGSARGQRMQQKFGSKSGFGMRMGAGMGMGMAAGFMGEEAQGAMNLGSSIAMINPLLGAAVGLGGAALKSKTVGGGMLTGAGAGAALGGMIGPGGAVVGAIVGGILGGVMGHFGKGKAAREEVEASARETAAEIWGGMIAGIDEARAEGGPMTGARMRRAMNVGQMSNILQSGKAALAMERESQEGPGHAARQTAIRSIYANQDALGVEMSVEERDKALRRPFEFLDEMLPEITKHHAVATTVLDKYTNRMDHMTDIFSVTEEELLEMATTVGVNLYDATVDTTEMIQKLSGALMLTRDAINNVFQEIQTTAYNALDKAAGVYEGEIGMDESARAFKELAASGDLDTSTSEGRLEVIRFLQDQIGFAKDLAGGDELGATSMINRLFGEGKAFTQTGSGGRLGTLHGLEGYFQDPVIQAALAEMLATTGPAKTEALTQTVVGNLGEQGLQGTFGANFSSVMGGLSGDKRDALNTLFADTRALESGTNMRDDEGDLTALGQGHLQRRLDEILGVGVVSNLQAIAEGVGTEAITGEDMVGFAKTFETSVGVFEVSIQDLVAKLGSDTKHPFGDTSSAMAGTLAAHNRISGGLAGKRTITSGYRNYALGSSNSDHVTGRALDLVGDNLGAYQRGIKSGGGYAEFHGMGDSRHLHAVPAIGDTSTSQGGMGTSNTSNYTINVTGGPNANAQEVASLVMNEIQNLQRTNRERS